MPTPDDYGLPHTEFYPHQLETIQWAEAVGSVGVVEASTGCGKTGLPAALANKQKVIALVKTKFLQEDNYEKGYSFVPLYGRGNYRCPYHGKPCTALDCTFTKGTIVDRSGNERPSTMADCPDIEDCEYFQQREYAKRSSRTVLNYPYWLRVHSSWPAPEILVCDEGHQLPEIILEWAGTTINQEQQNDWDLPMFPMIRSNGSKSAFGSEVTAPEGRAIAWLVDSVKIMKKHVDDLSEKAKYNSRARAELRKAELLDNKLKATLLALTAAPHDWFIRSGPGAVEGKQAFIAKPLTAKHHFKNYFARSWKLLIMSATIGDNQVFAAELGLPEHEFLRVPSRFTPEQKPVFALDVPRLGQKSKPTDWDKQADEIARGVKECPPTWNGIIEVTSYSHSKALAERLAKRGLYNRLFTHGQGESTAKVVQQWHERMDRKPGSLIITPVLGEGYNGTREKICISAKTPYPALTDDYSRCRQEYNPTLYLQRTAQILEQNMGRVRRGPEDYDTGGERMTYNALGDGGWRWVKKFFSQDFAKSIVEGS